MRAGNATAIQATRRGKGAALSNGEEQVRWRKSSHSNSGDCLEWLVEQDMVRLRDSTGGSSGEIQLSHSQWLAFLAAVKAGEADLPDGRDLDHGIP